MYLLFRWRLHKTEKTTNVKERQTATGSPMLIILDLINFGEMFNAKPEKLFQNIC